MKAGYRRDLPRFLLSRWPQIVYLPGTPHTRPGVHLSWWRLAILFGGQRTPEGLEATKRAVRRELWRRANDTGAPK